MEKSLYSPPLNNEKVIQVRKPWLMIPRAQLPVKEVRSGAENRENGY